MVAHRFAHHFDEPPLTPLQQQLQQIGVPPQYHPCSFASLEPEPDREAFDLCQHYAQAGECQGKRGLLLRGQTGNGKTSLAVAILRQRLAQGQPAQRLRFWNVPIGMYHLRAGRLHPDQATGHILALTQHELVVLDDLGKYQVTAWVQEQLYLLLNELWAEDKQVVLTTNLPAGALVQLLDPALVSRILGLCHEVRLSGPDRRGSWPDWTDLDGEWSG